MKILDATLGGALGAFLAIVGIPTDASGQF